MTQIKSLEELMIEEREKIDSLFEFLGNSTSLEHHIPNPTRESEKVEPVKSTDDCRIRTSNEIMKTIFEAIDEDSESEDC